MNATVTNTQTALDPVQARADFFFNLDMTELTLVIPKATPAPAPAVRA